MALPVDVSTFTLRFGKYLDATGQPRLVGLEGKLTPVDAVTGAPIRLLHTVTGDVIVPDPIKLVIGEDGGLDVAGLAHNDLDVLSPTPFAYDVVWTTATDRSPAPKSARIFVPAEMGDLVDFDKLVPAPSVPGLSVPISVSIDLLDEATAAAEVAQTAALTAAEEAGDALSAATLSQNAATAAQEAAEAAALDAVAAAASAAQAAVDAAAADPRLTSLENDLGTVADSLTLSQTDLAASTNLATADTLVRRDAAGNFNVNHTPTAAGHPASKTYADALGTSVATANTIVRRAANGWFAAAGISGLGLPGSPGDAASKAYVDAIGTASETQSTIVRRDGSGRSWFVQARATTTPTNPDELTRKDYVDTKAAAASFSNLDIIATVDPALATSTSAIGVANRANYQRIIGSGTITKVGVMVAATGGNIFIGLHRSVGSGRSAVPGALVASTGSVPCPAVGWAEISLGGSFTVQPGDWFVIAGDNGGTSFRGITGTLLDGEMFAGRAMYGNPGYPPPSNPTGLTIGQARAPLVIGVP